MGLRFPYRFIHCIIGCVRTVSYILVLNGEQVGYFEGKKGLRQGDPLSPLLMLLCLEYLSRKLTTTQDFFKFHKGYTEMRINQLAFADDLFIFCGTNINTTACTLNEFQEVSRLAINN